MPNLSDLVNPATQVVDDQKRLGNGQTWQDVTGSRASGVTYTNTTGRTIIFSVGVNDISSPTVRLFVDGLAISDGVAGISSIVTNSAVVPNGSTYRADVLVGTLATWNELR